MYYLFNLCTKQKEIMIFNAIFKRENPNWTEPRTVKPCPLVLHVSAYVCMHFSIHVLFNVSQCQACPLLISRSGTLFDRLIEVLQGRQAEVEGGSLHSWPFHEKRVQPWEWAKRRAQLCMVKQSPRLPASNVSANSGSLWSSRLQEDPGQEKKKKRGKETKKQTGT